MTKKQYKFILDENQLEIGEQYIFEQLKYNKLPINRLIILNDYDEYYLYNIEGEKFYYKEIIDLTKITKKQDSKFKLLN